MICIYFPKGRSIKSLRIDYRLYFELGVQSSLYVGYVSIHILQAMFMALNYSPKIRASSSSGAATALGLSIACRVFVDVIHW